VKGVELRKESSLVRERRLKRQPDVKANDRVKMIRFILVKWQELSPAGIID
jgi:hypothetical protein